MRTILSALIAVVLVSACSTGSTTTGPAGLGDCPAETTRYTDGAGTFWCQYPNGSRVPTI